VLAQQPQENGTNETLRTKVRRLDVRLSSPDHARIVEEAVRRQLSVSAYVRQALLGHIDYANDHDTRLLDTFARALDTRAEALAEVAGEIALTLLERVAPGPIPPQDRHAYVAGAVDCFRDALRRHLQRGSA
jgi:hypothetical protein